MPTARIELTRQQLYELVWSRPMRQLAEEFGIYDVGLGKICKKEGIPRPGRGHWAKVAAGAKVKRTKLPAPPPSASRIFHFPGGKAPREPTPAAPEVAVGARLSSPHEAVTWITTSISEKETDHFGRLVVGSKHHRPFCVTHAQKARALRILDALFKALADRGHEVQVGHRYSHSDDSEIVVKVGDRGVPLTIEEILTREPHVLTKDEKQKRDKWGWTNFPVYDYYADGDLCLRVAHAPHRYRKRKSWRDGKGRTLEQFLGRAVLAIEQIAEATRIDEEEYRRLADERLRKEQRRLRGERLRRYYDWLADDLAEMTKSWERAKGFRSFLHEYERRLGDGERTERVSAWLASAQQYVERLDPMHQFDRIAKDMDPSDESLEALISDLDARKARGLDRRVP